MENRKSADAKERTGTAGSPEDPGSDPFTVWLTAEETHLLLVLSHYHERALGPMRHVVRLTSNRETRAKYRFMADESTILEHIARARLAHFTAEAEGTLPVKLAPMAVIAFLGRAVSSITRARSRRKLSEAEVALREQLAAKLVAAVAAASPPQQRAVELALETRRPDEAGWVRDRLASAEQAG